MEDVDTTMDKLKLHSQDFIEQNIAWVAERFPNCITESTGDDGCLKKVVDFEQLRQELSDSIVEGPRERYQLDWPGKKEALLAANAPIAKTLRPCKEESVDFDTTKNLFIEGDNLDALKLLQETYLNKVKMIYIDPPYNTGKDFIYNDNFQMTAGNYYLQSNQNDLEGQRLVDNPESNGRFHSAWTSMIFSRLKLSRNLLREDGVIFVSIDDHEVANLRRIMDEVFGQDNFLATFLWKKMDSPSRNDEKRIASEYHDYILAYRRSDASGLQQMPKPDILDAYPLTLPDGRLARRRQLRKNGKSARREDRPSMWYKLVAPDGTEVWPTAPPPDSWEGRWSLAEETWYEREAAGLTEWIERDYGWVPYCLEFPSDAPSIPWPTWWDDLTQNRQAKAYFKELMQGSGYQFDNPKPIELMRRLLQIAGDANAIVLDFFCGSGSTADAVLQENAHDGGSRKFIVVQCEELISGNGNESIADLARERIRRSGNKARENNPLTTQDLDAGFRVLKVDTSNMKDVYYTPDGVKQGDLLGQIENIKEDRTPEDLLFQVLLDWGVDLSLPIIEEAIDGKTVFFVDDNALVACFETDINEELVKTLAARKPLRAVFRDSGYGNDSVKINVEQIFKLISPSTEVKSI